MRGNRLFATNDHMVQNPPCWRASSLLFPLDLPLFYCPSAGIIMSLPYSMADFVPCDRLLQKAYLLPILNFISIFPFTGMFSL